MFATDGVRATEIYQTALGGTIGSVSSVVWTAFALTADHYFIGRYTAPSGNRIVRARLIMSAPTRTELDPGLALGGTALSRSGTALGAGSKAPHQSVVIGALAGASLTSASVEATAVGWGSDVVNDAVAVGHAAKAVVTHGVAIGKSASATVGESVAIGSGSSAAGQGAVALGRSTNASNAGAIAVGNGVTAAGAGAISMGLRSSAPNTYSVAIGIDAITSADRQVTFGAKHVELAEVTAPAAPAADRARLYVVDNGAGKTQLVVRFATGAVQVLATEP